MVVGSALTSLAIRDIDLILPNLVAGQTNAFSIAYVIAFLPGLAWLVVLETRPVVFEQTSIRQRTIGVLDLAVSLGLPGVAFALLLCVGGPEEQGAARNLLLVAALCIVSGEYLPKHFAFLAPVAYLLASGSAGFEFMAPEPRDWALALGSWNPARDIPVLCLVSGGAVFARAGRSRRGYRASRGFW